MEIWADHSPIESTNSRDIVGLNPSLSTGRNVVERSDTKIVIRLLNFLP